MAVDVVFGTRPEVIKLAPVVHALRRSGVEVRLVSTGQHQALVDDLLVPLGLAQLPTVSLRAMVHRQRLNSLAAILIERLGSHLAASRPAIVIVQGDTTSALCASLVAFHEQIPVAHVEAGLRTGKLDSPFPEEMNRQLIARTASWNFCPTERAMQNLLTEGISPDKVLYTGNTIVDTLVWVRSQRLGVSAFQEGQAGVPRVLVTLHRRENHGSVMAQIAAALVRAAENLRLELVIPLHPNPAVQDSMRHIFEESQATKVIPPLSYVDLVATLAEATVVVTDSGGIQEEAPSFGVPVLVVRDTTERPEAIEAGCARLVGTDPEALTRSLEELVVNSKERRAISRPWPNPFGDGHAAGRIVDRLLGDLPGLSRARTETPELAVLA